MQRNNMLIGVVADSHDNMKRIEDAIGVFKERNVEHILHCGDIIAPFAAKLFTGCGIPVTAVFGNNDGERTGLSKVMDDIGNGPRTVTFGGRKIVVAHTSQEIPDGMRNEHDTVIFGHSHKIVVDRDDSAGHLVLNPGECCGWTTGRATVAVLYSDTLGVEIVDL